MGALRVVDENIFKDPKNLRYRLSTVIPGVAFLTSILTAVTMTNLKMTQSQYYIWIVALALFQPYALWLLCMPCHPRLRSFLQKLRT